MRKDFLQGYRSFIVWLTALILTIVLLIFPEKISGSMSVLNWFAMMSGLYLGRNTVKHGIDRRSNVSNDKS